MTGYFGRKTPYFRTTLSYYYYSKDNKASFLTNLKGKTTHISKPGAVALTKTQSSSTNAVGNYYHLVMWESETLPRCSGTNGKDGCIDASLEEVTTNTYTRKCDYFIISRCLTC